MRLILILLLSQAWAVEAPASPELVALEQRLTSAPHEKDSVRQDLGRVMERVARTPANLALEAEILARLGDQTASRSATERMLGYATRLYDQKDYSGALAYADAILSIDPRNPGAIGIRRLSEGRGNIASREDTKAASTPLRVSGPAPETDDRPFRLGIKVRPGLKEVPGVLMSTTDVGYVSPTAKKASPAKRFIRGVRSVWMYNFHAESASERKKLENVKKVLSSTPSGKRLISDLGGWEEIERNVHITFAPVASPGTFAYARPLIGGDRQGRQFVVVLNSETLNEPGETLAPVLAHELSHIKDMASGRFSTGLEIPSELSAHRQQVYVHQELVRSLPDSRRRVLAEGNVGNYQSFLANLWEDRILQRFPDIDSFSAHFAGDDIPSRARDAYRDLLSGVAKPGSSHLDFHLTSPETGVYTVLSDEKDILDLVRERNKAGGYSAAARAHDQRVLDRRAVMIGEMERLDSDYRQAHGYRIE